MTDPEGELGALNAAEIGDARASVAGPVVALELDLDAQGEGAADDAIG